MDFMSDFHAPPPTCSLCPRLVTFREKNAVEYPSYFNGAVPSFGSLDSALLVVGLAPGLKGANQTGRPFTGDYAGEVLYPALHKHGLAQGEYGRVKEDGFVLINTRITNAVRCVPPENKPETSEIVQCNDFLAQEIAAMPNLRIILSLGGISHKAVLKALNLKASTHPFIHAKEYKTGSITLLGSYHTSRYNVNTGKLTFEMFDAIIKQAKGLLG
jgi:uracil-DNA glycosylase family 4